MSGDRARDEATIAHLIEVAENRSAPFPYQRKGDSLTLSPEKWGELADALARLSADRDTPPEPGQATSKDFGDSRFASVVSSAALATPGPWRHGYPDGSGRAEADTHGGDILAEFGGPAIVNGGQDSWGVRLGVLREADAEFIVALVNWYWHSQFARAAEVSGGTPHEPEQATTDAGGHRSAVSVGAAPERQVEWWVIESETHIDAESLAYWGPWADRAPAEKFLTDFQANNPMCAIVQLGGGTTQTALPSLREVELARSVGRLEAERDEAQKWAATMEHERDWERDVVQSEFRDRLGRLEEALRALLEPWEAGTVCEDCADEDGFCEKHGTQFRAGLIAARAALVGVEPRPSEADSGAAGGGVVEESETSGGSEAGHEPSPTCDCEICQLVRRTLGTFS